MHRQGPGEDPNRMSASAAPGFLRTFVPGLWHRSGVHCRRGHHSGGRIRRDPAPGETCCSLSHPALRAVPGTVTACDCPYLYLFYDVEVPVPRQATEPSRATS